MRSLTAITSANGRATSAFLAANSTLVSYGASSNCTATITQAGSSLGKMCIGQDNVIGAKVLASGGDIPEGLILYFYDGDSNSDGVLLGNSNSCIYNRASNTNIERASRRGISGEHTIYIVVGL